MSEVPLYAFGRRLSGSGDRLQGGVVAIQVLGLGVEVGGVRGGVGGGG